MHSTESSISFATGGLDHDIKLWQPSTGAYLHGYYHSESQFSKDGRALIAAGYGKVRIYDPYVTNSPLATLSEFNKNVNSVGFNEDSSWVFAGGEDKLAKIIDWRSSKTTRACSFSSPINSMLLCKNQKEIILGTDTGEICVWDITNNKCQTTLFPDPLGGPIYSIAMNSEGTSLAAVNSGGFLLFWSVVSKEGISLSDKQRSKVHTSYGLKVQFSPDSTLLVTCGADNTFNVIKTADFEISHRQNVSSGHHWVWDCAFSADSRYLLTASSDALARLWNLEKCEVRFEYKGHKKAITCMAFRDQSLEDI